MRLASRCAAFPRFPSPRSAAAHVQRAYLSQRAGTTILLLHSGQPRTPYYAVQYMSDMLRIMTGMPASLSKYLSALHIHSSNLAQQCIRDSDEYPSAKQQLAAFASSLEKSLSTVTPEFRPVRCETVSRFDADLIEDKVDGILRDGTDRLLVIPTYPFKSRIFVQPSVSQLHKALNARTKRASCNTNDGTTTYYALSSPTSFELAVIEDLGLSESIVQYWAERLRMSLDGFEGVIFAVPPPFRDATYHSSVKDATKRVMYEVYKNYPRAVPWRVAHVPHWFQFWPQLMLPSVAKQVNSLRRDGRHRILVVPLCDFYQNFNTETVLPRLISQMNDVSLLSPLRDDTALVNSYTEVVKNYLISSAESTDIVMNPS